MSQSSHAEDAGFLRAGTQIISLNGERGAGADGEEVDTGANAVGVIDRVWPDQESCYSVIFQKSGVSIFLSKEELADRSNYAVEAADFVSLVEGGTIFLDASIGVDVGAYQTTKICVPILEDGSLDIQTMRAIIGDMHDSGDLTAFEPDWNAVHGLRIVHARSIDGGTLLENVPVDESDLDAGAALKLAVFSPQASQDPASALGAMLGAVSTLRPGISEEEAMDAVREFAQRLSEAVVDHDLRKADASKPASPRG